MAGFLKGKVAIVTGAAHPLGMGFASAKSLASEGATVFLADLPDASGNATKGLEDAVAAIVEEGGRAQAFAVDVTRRDQIDACVAHVCETFGGVDILFNNAGVGSSKEKFLDLTDADWAASFAVNVKGVSDFCQAVIPSMLKRGGGSIINNSSLAGLGAIELLPACYTATKHAVIGLTKAIALEFGPDNVRCNAICPGSIRTQMHANVLRRISEENDVSLEEADRIEAASVAMKRSADPKEVADVVTFLAGPQSSYLTGVALPVAAGMSPGI